MAAVSPMTWNWNWKMAGTGAAALAGVLGLGSPLQLGGPSVRPQVSDAPHASHILYPARVCFIDRLRSAKDCCVARKLRHAHTIDFISHTDFDFVQVS